jgi:exodeoxyribonuclease V alpha subunit
MNARPTAPGGTRDDARSDAPETLLATGFAEHVLRWARDAGAPEPTWSTVRDGAYRASLATATGHVCTHIGELNGAVSDNDPAVRALLRESGLVGTPEAPGNLPLIVDDDGRLYLHRYFDYERRLVRRLLTAGPAPLDRAAQARVAAQLATLFARNAEMLGARPDWQKIAAALACSGNLTIISGGPGTGKTTTVVNLLACLLAEDPDCRIALAAPTGKAAARMLEAIRERAQHLSLEVQTRLPTQSSTVHRLLGVTPASGTFRHDTDNPLAIDVLVVDEASMLDLALATKLLEAVPATARIVLLGDKDQLAAVEAGAVFAELCADPTLSRACITRLAALTGISATRIVPAPPLAVTPLHDHVVWFTENFRFARDSGIGRLAADIRDGNAGRALEGLAAAGAPDVGWIEDGGGTPASSTIDAIRTGYRAYFSALHEGAADPAAIFSAFGRFRVLCAERGGPRGVAGINEVLSRDLRQAREGESGSATRTEWQIGRPVMVLRNDYVLKLFNGDVGIVLPDATGAPLVYFPDSAVEGGFRAVAPVRLPEHETAFASTVHKAQGSEFDRVLLLLPAQPSRVVTRELVYTAVTRARAHVTLVTGSEVLAQAIASPTHRYSGLMARLREAGSW